MKLAFDELLRLFLSDSEKANSNIYPYLANKKEFDPQKDSVYYSGPYWDELEIRAALESLLYGKWLSSGEKVNQFERRFSTKFGFSSSVMVNSGSSANLVMIGALKKYFDWSDGDEIIVSAVGFPTTVSAILQNGLKPIFVDIDYSDLNWNVTEISNLISPRTRAVFSSPVLGNPYDLDLLMEICDANKIHVIADNCDSLGSKWANEFLTEKAVAASCSFYPAHHITTMEGGMVSSKTPEIVEIARSLAWWGRACYCVGRQNLLPDGTCKKRFSKWIEDCDEIVDHKYVFSNIGYNLKPLDLQGAIGIVQLDKFDEIETKRRANYQRMKSVVEQIPGCRVIVERSNSYTSWFGIPIVCESPSLKRALVGFLEKNRVQTRNYFAGNILQQPAYKNLGDFRSFPKANQVLSDVFFLGVSPTITNQMLDYVDVLINLFIKDQRL
jgi:CDP-6-deoxy-D-xylo-4-hexulose-3-dehydrase